MDATIVIPTKNAGPAFRQVLESLFSQKTCCSYEVVCIDSGSRDGTLDLIRQYPIKLETIPPESFGHGKTRNLGASLGSGKYIIFLTQDALPINDKWLQGFFDAMNMDEGIVAAFGRHVPYPDCNLLDARDINGLFDSYGDSDMVIGVEDWSRYHRDKDYARWLAFFSDNNACLLRSEWEKHPYPDVNFCEDQLWMSDRIAEGKKKAYAAHAIVYHSHNFQLVDLLGRYYDEYRALNQLFDGFMLVDRWKNVPHSIKELILHDFQYIDGLDCLTAREKGRWKRYAVCRDVTKILFGFLGGRSNRWPKSRRALFDRCVSQQYRQRSN